MPEEYEKKQKKHKEKQETNQRNQDYDIAQLEKFGQTEQSYDENRANL